jgi:hypothetical protein
LCSTLPGEAERQPGSGSPCGTIDVSFHYVAPVSTPDGRADNSERNDAVKLVDDALKAGRIVQADHDMRVAQLKGAQTMQDIDTVVRDLRAVAPAAPPTIAPVPGMPYGQQPSVSVPTAAGQPWPLVNYGPASHETVDIATAVGKTGGRAIGGIIAAVVMVAVVVPIAGAIIAFVSSRNSFPDFGSIGPTDDTTYAPGQAPGKNGINVHTVEGYNDMVDAVREKTGETYAFSAVIYPRYAVLEVPTGTNQRYEDFYWDGELTSNDIKGTTTDAQFDLGQVDPNQLIEMLDLVRGRIENPTSWYVIIGDHSNTGAQISAYASNEFSENAYVVETLDGTVVYDSATS